MTRSVYRLREKWIRRISKGVSRSPFALWVFLSAWMIFAVGCNTLDDWRRPWGPRGNGKMMNFPNYGNPDLGMDYSAISKVLVYRTVADDGSGRLGSPDSIIDDAALVARLATTVKDTPQLSPTIEVTYSPPYLFVGVDHSGEVVDA